MWETVMRRNGFTVIELIIVLIILAVLAAIVYPVFVRTHCNERGITCRSNLRQITLSFKQYIQDYDARFPLAVNSKNGTTKGSWAGGLRDYLKSQAIFLCPSDKKATRPPKSSYGYNAWLDKVEGEKIKKPNLVVLNFEVIADPNNWTQTGTSPLNVTAYIRHLDSSNFSFVDGHVKWLKLDKVSALPLSKGKPTFVPQ
jgi:prepilin-type N-terminal cleavage/methylation domain-containing protein/prepilin-type processing-associated H-X9-DG protein